MIEIIITTDFVTLGQFLKISGLIMTGGEAKHFLLNNLIKVNNIPENRRGKKLFDGDLVEIENKTYKVVNK